MGGADGSDPPPDLRTSDRTLAPRPFALSHLFQFSHPESSQSYLAIQITEFAGIFTEESLDSLVVRNYYAGHIVCLCSASSMGNVARVPLR